MKLRIIPLLLSLLLLCSCGKVDEDTPFDPLAELQDYYGAEAEDDPTPLTTFTLPYHKGETWDPITCPDGVQQTLSCLVYETMYVLDETFTAHPLLVDRADYDAETFTYTLHVRDGVRFSDGVVMTAQDVAESLRRACASARYANRLQQVEKITIDEDTVVVKLWEDNGAFTSLLDIPVVQSGTEGNTVPVGTGPYLPASDMTQLIPNSAWWQEKALPFTEIALLPYKSEEAAAYAFASNDVHLLLCDLLSDVDVLSASDDDSIYVDSSVMHYLGFNMSKQYFSDPQLRQAISMVIDRETIVNACLAGHAVATEFAVNPASPLYPTELERDNSSATLQETMAALELSDGKQKYQMRLLVNSENSFKAAAAESIALALNRYDFEVTVLALDWEDFLYSLSMGYYDIYYGECKLGADWDLTALLGAGCTLNYGGYESPAADTYMAALRSAGESDRAEAMEALCRHVQEDAPIIPLCFERLDLLLPQGAVDVVTPTAANPFYGLERWQVHWGEPVNLPEE